MWPHRSKWNVNNIQRLDLIYRLIHKSLRDFRLLRYSSRDGHAEGEHVNRGRDTAASRRVDISRTCKVGQKLGVSLPLLTCSPSAWPSRLLYRRGRKSRRDLWINLNNINKDFLITWPLNCKETAYRSRCSVSPDIPFLCFILLIDKILYFVANGHGHREACKLIHIWQLEIRSTAKYLDSSVASNPQNAVVLELVRTKIEGRNCTTGWQVCDCGWGTYIHSAVQKF